MRVAVAAPAAVGVDIAGKFVANEDRTGQSVGHYQGARQSRAVVKPMAGGGGSDGSQKRSVDDD